MAIDTELKRRSVQNYAIGSPVLPTATGAVENEDRFTLAWMYAGISYAADIVFVATALEVTAGLQGTPTRTDRTLELDYS